MADLDRIVGTLEGGIKGLDEKLDLVLGAQERIERDYKEAISRHEREEAEARRRIYERIEREAGGNAEAFKVFRETLNRLNDHIARFESTSDMVEGHAAAILDHENRVKHMEDVQKAVVAKAQQNKVWIRSIVGIAGLLESLHLGGGKLLKWLETFSK